jgi:hypothetical protein
MRTLRTSVALAMAAAALSACYVVPITAPDGSLIYSPYPYPPPPVGATAPVPQTGSMPAVLTARLYPSNDVATQTGVVTGTVTNMMTGKGRFQVTYLGQVLTGEATRVSNDERRGVASAYSPSGMYMSCEYQMNTPFQGAGTCTFSNGATYQLHLGNA